MGGQAMGNLRDGGQAWLSVKIRDPSDSSLGGYRCEGFGVDSTGHIQTVVADTDVRGDVLTPDMMKAMLKQTLMEKMFLKLDLDQAEEKLINVTSELTDVTAQYKTDSAEYGKAVIELGLLKSSCNATEVALEEAKANLSKSTSELNKAAA